MVRTLFGILPRDLSDGISNPVAHMRKCLVAKTLQELLPNGNLLRLQQQKKQLRRLVLGRTLPSLGGNPSDQDRCERPGLRGEERKGGVPNNQRQSFRSEAGEKNHFFWLGGGGGGGGGEGACRSPEK